MNTYDAMLGDAHPAVHGYVETTTQYRPCTSAVIDSLDGLRNWRHDYLCNYLSEFGREHYGYVAARDAEMAIRDFVTLRSGMVHSQLRGTYRGYTALAELWRLEREADGIGKYEEWRSVVHEPEFLAARDKFCRDYAAFLREFGL